MSTSCSSTASKVGRRRWETPNGLTARYHRLCRAWGEAIDQLRRSPSFSTATAEQAAHDELLELIECQGLEGTAFDPRHPDFPSATGRALSAETFAKAS